MNTREEGQVASTQCESTCHDDEKALQELAEAKARLSAAKEELKHAVQEVGAAEHDLSQAEAELNHGDDEHGPVHFFVDGEKEESEERKLTPDFIIAEYGKKDPATNYLIENDKHKRSFKGKGNVPIRIHECASFQIISCGPTPVSDGSAKTGVEVFAAGLHALGYEPAIAPGKPDHVMFDYNVEVGKHAGQQVRLGFQVPSDFPLTPPGGPHVSPHIHPIKPKGEHPSGAVHESSFKQATGGEWQYWSRPYGEWGKAKKTVASYMAHIYKLWETQ